VWKNEAERLEKEAPKGMVTAHVWFLISEGRVLGAIALRDTLNDYPRGAGGHIGYGVRPSERRKAMRI